MDLQLENRLTELEAILEDMATDIAGLRVLLQQILDRLPALDHSGVGRSGHRGSRAPY